MPSVDQRSWELFLQEMDEARIDRVVLMGGQFSSAFGWMSNDEITEITRDRPERFIAFSGIDPTDPEGAARRLRERSPGLGSRASRRIRPGRRRRSTPTTRASIWCTRPVSASARSAPSPPVSSWDPTSGTAIRFHIQRVAMRFPDLRIVVGHAWWPHFPTMVGVAMQCANVYLAPDFYAYIPSTPMVHEFARAADSYLRHRLLYSSGYPVRPPGQSDDEFRQRPLEPEVMENCLWRNAARLLDLPPAA